MREQVEMLEHHPDLLPHPVKMLLVGANKSSPFILHLPERLAFVIVPLVGSSSVISMRPSVVLPEPLGPIMANFSPAWSDRSMPLITSSSPNDFVTPSYVINGLSWNADGASLFIVAIAFILL